MLSPQILLTDHHRDRMRTGFDMLGFTVSSLQHIGWKNPEMGQGMTTVLFCFKFSQPTCSFIYLYNILTSCLAPIGNVIISGSHVYASFKPAVQISPHVRLMFFGRCTFLVISPEQCYIKSRMEAPRRTVALKCKVNRLSNADGLL